MFKPEYVKSLHETFGVALVDARNYYDHFFTLLRQDLLINRETYLPTIGTLYIRKGANRRLKDFKTGVVKEFEGRKKIKFKPVRDLERYIAYEEGEVAGPIKK